MTSFYLTTAISNADYLYSQLMEYTPSSKLNSMYYMASQLLIQKGTCSSLHLGTPQPFHDASRKSANLFISLAYQHSAPVNALSHSESFWHAIAANQLGMAEEITQLAPKTFSPNYEYEEEYFFHACLMAHYFSVRFPQPLEDMIEAWESLIEEVDPRLDLIKAVVDDDEQNANEAFLDFLDWELEGIENQIERGTMREEEWAWQRYVSVNGLALLRLLQLSGFAMNDIYHRIPPLLTEPVTAQGASSL